MPWYALQTKPRHEQKVAERLKLLGVGHYLPLYLSERQWSDRIKRVWMPLFRSYVFVNLNNYAAECQQVLQTPGCRRFLWWLGKPARVTDEEIQAIQRFLGDFDQVSMDVQLEVGDRVEIVNGAMMKQSGILLELDKGKATLLLTSMNMKVQVTLNQEQLALLNR